MSVLAQGTEIFYIDPTASEPQVMRVVCATSFDPGGNPADQIEDTCLEDTTRSYQPGLRTPGQATLSINADPCNASHLNLYELSQTDPSPVLHWAVGWSDGTSEPTIGPDGDFELPEDRTWFVFDGYVADFPFSFAANSVVTSDVSIQRSGPSAWIAGPCLSESEAA